MDLKKLNQTTIDEHDTLKSEVSSDDELLQTTFKDAINNKKFSKEYIKNKLIAFMEKLKVLQFFKTKTAFCKHCEGSCFSHAIAGFKNSFKKAYLLKIVVAFLFTLMKGKLSNFLLSEDTLRFALFPALFSLIYRVLLCYLRHIRGKEDGLNTIVASVIGSGAVFLDNDRDRRHKIALYTSVRAFQTLTELSDRRGIIKKLPNFEILTYMFSTVLPVYLFVHEKEV
jgi:hypothetical protein